MSEQDEEVTVDTNTEVEEATESNEDSEQEDTEAEDEEVVPKAQYNQVFARAKKAERELNTLKSNPPVKNDPQLSDELKLIARGLSDEEIEKAKVIAKGNGTSLNEALKDDMFIAYQTKLKEDKRKADAKLGASRGSGESQDNTLIQPEMSRDEHMEAFKKVMG